MCQLMSLRMFEQLRIFAVTTLEDCVEIDSELHLDSSGKGINHGLSMNVIGDIKSHKL